MPNNLKQIADSEGIIYYQCCVCDHVKHKDDKYREATKQQQEAIVKERVSHGYCETCMSRMDQELDWLA